MVIIKLELVFPRKPADKAFTIDMQLYLLSLLFNSLLQAFIFTLQQKDLSFELNETLDFSSQLLASNLGHVLHVCLFGDVTLMLFVKVVYLLPQLLFLSIIRGTNLGQISFSRLVSQVLPEHFAS